MIRCCEPMSSNRHSFAAPARFQPRKRQTQTLGHFQDPGISSPSALHEPASRTSFTLGRLCRARPVASRGTALKFRPLVPASVADGTERADSPDASAALESIASPPDLAANSGVVSGAPAPPEEDTAAIAAAATAAAVPPPLSDQVPYDSDTTLYTIVNLFYGTSSSRVELFSPRPNSSRTLSGTIRLEPTASALAQGKSGLVCRFLRVTRNEAGNSLRPENEAKMQKWGYHGKDELKEELLFEVRSSAEKRALEWWGEGGSVLALETEGDRRLEILEREGMSVRTKEALIACWAARCWAPSKGKRERRVDF